MILDAAPDLVVLALQHDHDHSNPSRSLISFELTDQILSDLREQEVEKVGVIDLWLETSGGMADAAYKLVLILRAHAEKLRVVVPDRAKSAGTLIALGADTIYMTPWAELGPLDAQVHWEPAGVPVSALDIANAMSSLALEAGAIAGAVGRDLISQTGLAREKVLGAVTQFTADIIKPLIEQLDPTLLHRANNQLRVAEDYATRLQRATGGSVDPAPLVTSYAQHGFIIDREEARSLGMSVEDMSKYPLSDAVGRCQRMVNSTGRALVGVMNPDDLEDDDDEGETDDDSHLEDLDGDTKSESADGRPRDDGSRAGRLPRNAQEAGGATSESADTALSRTKS